MSPENIQMALARNFGGTENNAKLCNIYFGDVLKTFNNQNSWLCEPIPIEQLIDSNLDERDTRHLMVIGKSDSIVDLLTYQLRRKNLEPVVILGSQFPDDQGDYSYSVLNRIMVIFIFLLMNINRKFDLTILNLSDVCRRRQTVNSNRFGNYLWYIFFSFGVFFFVNYNI